MIKKSASILFAVAFSTVIAFAQEDKGNFSAGFETNTTFYFNDEKTGAIAPDGRFGSNDYLKIDYSKGGFSMGAQFESYLPAILGYFPMNLSQDLFLRYDIYAAFEKKGWDIRAGSLYEQFGNGLLFRTYEDRALGVNNALQGIRVGYTFGDYLTIKGIYGRTRSIKEYSNAIVSGADLSFSISRAAKMKNFDLAVEGSVLDKYETVPYGMEEYGIKAHSSGYSARVSMGYAGVTLKGEYIDRKSDPGFYNGNDTTRSKSYQIDLGYSGYGFGGLITFRQVRNPFLQGQRDEQGFQTYINYVPALTQQHTYALASLTPYSSQSRESGGQIDLYYNFKRGTKAGGVKGMKIHTNFSTFYGGIMDFNSGDYGENELLFRDLTVDVERWYGKNFKMILYYTWQTYNPKTKGEMENLWNSHVLVADMMYKFNRKHSLRWEVQHLFSRQNQGSWAGVLVEYNFAPRWSVSMQDMWNYDDTNNHYVNGSISYSYSNIRAAINAGRFKEGYLCSGGVCRITPAYTGINLSLIVNL